MAAFCFAGLSHQKLFAAYDLTAEQSYIERDSRVVALVELAGARSFLTVPMLKEGELIGAISIYRPELRPFSDKQIELIKSFANQAVIAIENARLMIELRQRTTDLSESLERQTATSEVLQVISSSPGELGPVFDAVLEKATRICQAKFGNLFLREDDTFRAVALHGSLPPAYAEHRRREPLFSVHELRSDLGLVRLARTKEVVHIPDRTWWESEGQKTPRIFRWSFFRCPRGRGGRVSPVGAERDRGPSRPRLARSPGSQRGTHVETMSAHWGGAAIRVAVR